MVICTGTYVTELWGIICNLFLVLKAAAFTCPANLLPYINLCVSENYLIFPIMAVHLMKDIYLQRLHSLSLYRNSYSKVPTEIMACFPDLTASLPQIHETTPET